MTKQTFVSSMKSESGFALVLVILCLLVVSGLTTAMVTSGRTEVLISVNQERAAQARAAAEAGLNHGTALAITYVRNWQANGHANASDAMTRLLLGPDVAPLTADDGSFEALPNGIPRPPARVVLSAAEGTAYDAHMMDEDDPARGLSLADHARVLEPASDPTDDESVRLVVRATGYADAGTVTRLEVTIGPVILPAILVDGDLEISGNPTVGGANGSVHANSDLTISGNPTITKNATASATYTVTGTPNIGGQSGGGRPVLTVPPVNAADHRAQADFILQGDGRMIHNQTGALVCDASADNDACKNLGYGWKYSPSGGAMGLPQWNIDSNTGPSMSATFYVEGDARISGNPGSAASPLSISIIAEGDIEISGNPHLRPDLPELMLVTDRDLKISGLVSQPIAFEGQMLVHEQMHISGNPTLAGQILVEDAPSVSTLVTANTVSGNPTIVYNGLVGSNTFQVSGWREIR